MRKQFNFIKGVWAGGRGAYWLAFLVRIAGHLSVLNPNRTRSKDPGLFFLNK